MKTIITIASVFFCSIALQAQTNFDSLVAMGTENIPIQIKNEFPKFAEMLLRVKANDKYIHKIYFGDYYFKTLNRTYATKGVILFDKSFILNKEARYDISYAWGLFISVGAIHFVKENPSNQDTFSFQKSRLIYALNNATEITKQKNDCSILQFGINSIIEASAHNPNRNIRAAAEELSKEVMFVNAKDLSEKSGCPVKQNAASPRPPAPNNSNKPDKENSTSNNTEPQNNQIVPVEEAMKNIRSKVDEFSGFTSYYSDRTPKDPSDVDRLFISLNKHTNGRLVCNFWVLHNALTTSSGLYMNIEQIFIKTDNSTYVLDCKPQYIFGNGTQHSFYKAGFIKEQSPYKWALDIMNSNVCKVRFLGEGRFLDFEVSTREKKAIKDVITLYEAFLNQK
ncbi:MAG: hypothetical protein JSR12_10930 [Bacteroidetes bacterium]|nr:hypothetical protein [Bacteroidota bacterium]